MSPRFHQRRFPAFTLDVDIDAGSGDAGFSRRVGLRQEPHHALHRRASRRLTRGVSW